MAFMFPEITRAIWTGPTAIQVDFASSSTGYIYQLYAGRRLIGGTTVTEARTINAQLDPSSLPQHLTVLAVEPENEGTDYGAQLPLRPYNVVRLTFDTTGFDSDARYIDITAGTEPGGAVDSSNRLARLQYDEAGEYTFESEPLDTGTWNFEITALDDKEPDGNASTAVSAAATVLSYPADVETTDGERFTVEIDAGTATLTWT